MLTFTRTIQNIDPLTGAATPVVSTITCEGMIKAHGNPERYRALGLIASAAPTLFVAGTDYPRKAFTPEFVLLGDTTEINGVVFTVRDVDVFAPDGFVIIANIIVGI